MNILYVDGHTGEVVAVRDAAELPERERFADTPAGQVAVARVVAFSAPTHRFVHEYAEDGTLLRTTTVRRGKPAAKRRGSAWS